MARSRSALRVAIKPSRLLGDTLFKEGKESKDPHWLDGFAEPSSPRNDDCGTAPRMERERGPFTTLFAILSEV